MVKVIANVDCGNSPKNLFLKQFNVAFAEGDVELLIASVSEDIIWKIVGVKAISGKTEFVAELGKINFNENSTVYINRVITHGKEGAVSGEIIMNSGKKYAFCDFYEFSSVKGSSIKLIESYNVEIN